MPELPGWNLPFEATEGALHDLTDMTLAGSITVLATVVDVPQLGPQPGLVFRFGGPDGSLLKPILLLLDVAHMNHVATLVEDAVVAAVVGAERAR